MNSLEFPRVDRETQMHLTDLPIRQILTEHTPCTRHHVRFYIPMRSLSLHPVWFHFMVTRVINIIPNFSSLVYLLCWVGTCEERTHFCVFLIALPTPFPLLPEVEGMTYLVGKSRRTHLPTWWSYTPATILAHINQAVNFLMAEDHIFPGSSGLCELSSL